MKFAMEVPEPHLNELSAYTDFDFALAHKALQYGPDSLYSKFYRKQADSGRIVWLDNSFHELERSLTPSELITAIAYIQPTHIVAPETYNNPQETYAQIVQFKELLKTKKLDHIKVVGSWQGYGKDLVTLLELCDEVALPWRRPRIQHVNINTSKEFHYFGFKNLDELRIHPPKSLDTSIPIRAAFYGIDLTTRERRPQTPLLDFDLKLTLAQLEQTVKNIELLRRATRNEV
jgi:hypothetical protein